MRGCWEEVVEIGPPDVDAFSWGFWEGTNLMGEIEEKEVVVIAVEEVAAENEGRGRGAGGGGGGGGAEGGCSEEREEKLLNKRGR